MELQQAAGGLADRERAAFALWLLDTLPAHSEDDAALESIAEASRRRDELDSGGAIPIADEEFWASVERERAACLSSTK
jgi:hypothetical protein